MSFRKVCFLVSLLVLCSKFCFAQELIPKEAADYYVKGVQEQKAGNFDAANMNYQKTLLMDPNNTKWNKFILNNRGVMFAQSGDLETAEKAFKEVLRMDPDYTPAKLNLGLIIDKRRSKCESLEYWAKVFNLEKRKPRELFVDEGLPKAKK
ncbi:MAG: tetratricopeptide repeat protein [Candidatus Omnitrophica bacterium]|nr:tetratricopeptide repeat protein [Candidatus Omnitrophota bacterium]